jgi:hypothetical protein
MFVAKEHSRTSASRLRWFDRPRIADLLDTGDMFRNILDRHRILYRQPMRLTLHSRLVNQDSSIGR